MSTSHAFENAARGSREVETAVRRIEAEMVRDGLKQGVVYNAGKFWKRDGLDAAVCRGDYTPVRTYG